TADQHAADRRATRPARRGHPRSRARRPLRCRAAIRRRPAGPGGRARRGRRALSPGGRMIALYLPGRSMLHRAPAGAKLIGLIVLALLISLWPHTGITIAVAGLLVVGLYALALFPPMVLLRQLWLVKWIVVLMV